MTTRQARWRRSPLPGEDPKGEDEEEERGGKKEEGGVFIPWEAGQLQ